jgi:hypothetical protein
MRLRRRGGALAAAAALAVLILVPGALRAQRYVAGGDPAYPHAKYPDSLVSLNDRCIVAGNKLNLAVRPVYVNGQPIGFC